MIKSVLSALFVIIVSISVHAQVRRHHLISGDTLGSVNNDFIQLTNNQRIELMPLYDPDFALFSANFGSYPAVESLAGNDSIAEENTLNYFSTCEVSPVEIVDSIDLNEDGTKELVLLRRSSCFVSPPTMGPYGEGGQQHSYENYEVWDVKQKQQLFEVRNIRESQVAITTNVIQTFGYRFEVTIDQKGRFHISGLTDGSNYEPGTYKYNTEKGLYEKE
ncbi:MAG: hypothetical protein QE487_06290 [Fluviicola sp.]|nr:hypothetical protein [Fluviicola sp.]